MLPVDDAWYNSAYSMTIKRRGCTAETREAVHQALQDWTTDPDSQKIYWMNGMAGTGKTTIAYSYCEWLESTHRLGASFFCSRISSTCRSLARIVPTIAYQLARYSPAFRSKLCASLKDNPDAGTLNVMQQFERLVNQPMLKCKTAIPDGVVVLIDALDECDDTFSVRMLLNVLLKFAGHLPLKFFVSSRPEHAIRDRMLSQGGAPRAIVHLHDIEQSIVEEDIKKYLTEALSSMTPPPPPKQIELLAQRSRNLFIYAATVVRYIYPEDIHVDSSARLRSILATISDPKAITENKYEDLDRLYTTVLSAVFNSRLDSGEKSRMQRVLWTIVCAREPMTVGTIASLASLEEHQVWAALQSLRSVVHVPENDTLISALHASFPEYMLDELRSGGFYCDQSLSNERLVHRFFDIMRLELRFNICNLNSSYLTDDHVDDFEALVSQCISPTLSYACRYWSSHLLLAPASSGTSDKVVDFLSNRLLFWMEVLSLSQCIGIGAPMVQQVQSWFRRVAGTSDELQKRVSDARNFVTWFAANPCSRSTPHIYISALPLCAKSNWVHQHYSRRMQGLANIAINQRDEAVLAIWSVGSEVNAIAISPDGGRIAAGVDDGSILFYDTNTGAIALEPFKGHTNFVMSVAFSPDGTLVASGSYDETVIIWDVHTGRMTTGPLRGHSGKVYHVAFSPDGNQVVSGSDDNTAIVWNAYSGDIATGPLKGHSGAVNSVAFSPDGRLIASGSADRTIRLWDANTGATVAEPYEGHDNTVWMVAFSPDGSQLASCSEDNTIRLWDIKHGTLVGQPFTGHEGGVRSLAFSPDGTHIVSGSLGGDYTITVWNIVTRLAVFGPLRGHTRIIRSVVFLPDSTRVASCSYDGTIRMWDVQTKEIAAVKSSAREIPVGPVAFVPDRTQYISSSSNGTLRLWDIRAGVTVLDSFDSQIDLTAIHSIAISSQGTHVAASSTDFSIRVWNTLTGVMVFQPLSVHNDIVICLTFSPDGAFICSGSEDRTIIVWDIGIGAMVGQPYKGHEGSVRSVGYSNDGTRIASGSADRTVRIWDPNMATLVQTLAGHEDSVESVEFSLDGRYIFSGSADSSIRRWDLHGVSDPVQYHCSGPVTCVALSSDGTHVVAGFGSSIGVFDGQLTGMLFEQSLPRMEEVEWVGFSADSTRIISVSIAEDIETEGSEDTATEDLEPEQVVPAPTQKSPPRPNIIRVWCAPTGLNQTDSSSYPGDWSYNHEGRILSSDGLVMWVSPDIIPFLEQKAVSKHNPYIWTSDGVVDLGYRDLCLGDRWAECYTHNG